MGFSMKVSCSVAIVSLRFTSFFSTCFRPALVLDTSIVLPKMAIFLVLQVRRWAEKDRGGSSKVSRNKPTVSLFFFFLFAYAEDRRTFSERRLVKFGQPFTPFVFDPRVFDILTLAFCGREWFAAILNPSEFTLAGCDET